MKITQVFQKLIALVALVAVTFGLAAPSASAAILFSAPGLAPGAPALSTSIQYFTSLETGTVFSKATSTQGENVLFCNNFYQQGAGSEWQSKCLDQKNLPSLEEGYVVQSYSKSTGPGGVCWKKVNMYATQVPPVVPGNNRYLISGVSQSGSSVAQITIEGPSLQSKGETEPKSVPFAVCP
ncbi:MAG: hypothetical protein JGK17_29885 [Microcoleus sp. PH2017_10_PVI_O_A]|uniref:hypothetical protein n=1 Tax=unclassified Microcoleus TaxID=2642155 RepID=UPI001D374A92|nr:MULTISPECIES: hypothetical protein [unclassified Microcoleus]MCC3409688.1 hypothetical protein [Microcoleus sp. PH2017_10_PVI_O_A]MCC3463953.1 hypothetical protein [Microcoleus sp. PH2017_11_PCY_U_A]MCC3482278.1 hypothetical protein [Microcoleus sp. PH2017_12_PCY_D_A]MCC3563258.1 hypothetical protein [Microcoleus sp. PH2017_27_LUM_O_A]